MAILTTLSNFDISNNIVDSNENIIVWYNGTKIKYYHRYEQVTTEVETISGIISIKLLSDTNVKITTASKVRELILTRPGTTNTYTITLDSNYSTANDGSGNANTLGNILSENKLRVLFQLCGSSTGGNINFEDTTSSSNSGATKGPGSANIVDTNCVTVSPGTEFDSYSISPCIFLLEYTFDNTGAVAS